MNIQQTLTEIQDRVAQLQELFGGSVGNTVQRSTVTGTSNFRQPKQSGLSPGSPQRGELTDTLLDVMSTPLSHEEIRNDPRILAFYGRKGRAKAPLLYTFLGNMEKAKKIKKTGKGRNAKYSVV
jgi:hypothetical protein